MVTRKPAPEVNTSSSQQQPEAAHSAPYPTTPIEPPSASSIYSQNDTHFSPTKSGRTRSTSPQKKRRDSDGSIATNGTWDDSDDNLSREEEEEAEEEAYDGFVEVPQPLKIRPSSQDIHSQKEDLPAALRPGGGGGGGGEGNVQNAEFPAVLRPGPPVQSESTGNNPWVTTAESKNPYKQPKAVESHAMGNSQAAWQHTPPLPVQPSQAPPTINPPTEEMSRMDIAHERSTTSPTGSYVTAEVLHVPHKGMPPPFSPVGRNTTGGTSQESSQAFPTTNPWSGSEGHPGIPSPGLPPKEALSPAVDSGYQPHYPSDDGFATSSSPPPARDEQEYEHSYNAALPPTQPAQSQYQPPPGLQYQPPQGPPPESIPSPEQLIDHSPYPTTSTAPPQPNDPTRSELYQVKHIRWFDAHASTLRSSPILTQNANGPCPLLALVNAIIISTPANLSTPLLEALSDNGNRTQISLGFLLDALFDELTSGGRGGETAQRLPDVTELYAFLLALHTGMNVNPRFIINPSSTPRGSLDGHSAALDTTHLSSSSQTKAGTFESTKEMTLYSTLSIPLIHGWIPAPGTSAYSAFARSAQTFELAQNIQFLEPDLLALSSLSPAQQDLLFDIRVIKNFLAAWPTQLTEYGLEAISSSLAPGEVAILFRNDHFSTVYKEPRGGALMTLVTDMGYSCHEEIVWESLVDVGGSGSEMFSGDFRVVGHGSASQTEMDAEGGDIAEWGEAQSRVQQETGRVAGEDEVAPPLPGPRPIDTGTGEVMSTAEQEDHDLALALQLQEEEEDAQRQSEARRRREQELSERFLERNESPPTIPPRRGSGRRTGSNAGRGNTPIGQRRTSNARPAVNRPAAAQGEEGSGAPPPSYEESRGDRVVRPGEAPPRQGQGRGGGTEWGGFGSSPQVNNRGRVRGRGMSSGLGRGSGGQARGGHSPGGAANVREAEERCGVM